MSRSVSIVIGHAFNRRSVALKTSLFAANCLVKQSPASSGQLSAAPGVVALKPTI